METRLRLDASLWCVAATAGATPVPGLGVERLIGKPFADCLASGDAAAVVETLRATLEESSGALIIAAIERGPLTRWIEIEASTLDRPDADGAVLELVVRDATDRVGEETRLRAALASERTLSAIASRLAGWPDTELGVVLRLCLEDLAARFGADRARFLARPDVPGPVVCLGAGWSADIAARSEDAPVADGVDPVEDAWLDAVVREGAWVEGLPLDRLPPEADDWRRILACEELAAGLVVPCRLNESESSASLELAWRAPRAPLTAEERRLAGRLGELFAGWLERRRAADSREAAARRRADEFVAARERFRGLAGLSRFFVDVDVDALREGLEAQLAVLAGMAEAERCWLLSYATGDDELEWFEGWRADVSRRPGPSLDRRLASFAWSTGEVTAGRVLRISDPERLPEAARAEREDMRTRGVRAVLGIPIVSGGRHVGALGFECFERAVVWSDERVMLLRVAGEILYTALRQHRAVEELRESQAQLLQAQKMEAVGTLAGGIAHDFNNHLAVMLGNARFVRQEVTAEPDVIEAIQDFERSADHCAQLTRSLLAFSRRSPVEVGPVEVAELVQGVEGLVRPLLPEAVGLETVLMEGLGAFAVDRVQIQQVLVNLLVNARDAMAEEGGTIRLDARRRPISTAEATAEGLDGDAEYVVLSVRDTGCGMDEETRGRVFEPFFTTKAPGQGTGLGLAMAYGIVRQSRGAIAVESTPGHGTIFRVYLPSVDRDAESSSAEGPARPSLERLVARRSGRVLLLEPEPAVRRLVGRILAGAGYEVELAESSEVVRRRVAGPARGGRAAKPDLVIAAHSRPERSLDFVVDALRGPGDETPVLLLTGYSVPCAGRAGNVSVLLKPFDEDRLLTEVDRVLAGTAAGGMAAAR
ncbi:MAG: ATP-binding protein [Myxococcota bacterium]